MKISKSKQRELDKAYKTIVQVCLFDMPLSEIEPYLPDDVMNFGAGITEITTSKEPFLKQIENQKAIASGLEMEFQIKPVMRKITNGGNGAIYTDDIINTVLMNGVNNELQFRWSFIFEYVNEKWIMIHSHTSAPDSQRNDDEVWPVEDLKRRTEFLEKSLEEKIAELEVKNRELEIETALERVRAKAMSMHNSDELDEVLAVLCSQFDVLGILPMSTHMTVFDFENDQFTFRETGKFGDRSFGEQTVALDAMDTWKETVDQWRASKAQSINRLHFPKETLPQVWEVFHESFASMPEGSRITPDDYPDGIYHTAGKHPFGYIGMNQIRKATEEEEQIVVKFANEFGRAYQRFLDLKNAETQAREAQIEASLEKVRVKGMAINSTREIESATAVVFNELSKLGVSMERCGITLMNETPIAELWSTTLSQDKKQVIDIVTGFLDFRIDSLTQQTYKDWKAKKKYSHYKLVGDALKNYYSKLEKQPKYKFPKVVKYPDQQICHSFFFNAGAIFVYTKDEFSLGEKNILHRFAKVFEQTYTRFLDLQKAEAQAREAHIEAALERVRSRSMGMQRSEELKEVIKVIFNQLALLNINAEHAGIVVDFKPKEDWNFWVAETQDIPSRITVPYLDSLWDRQYTEAKEKGKDFFATLLNFEEKNSFYKELLEHIPELTEEARNFYFSCPGLAISTAIEKDVGLYIENFSGTPYTDEENEVLKRFVKVFQQTYTRFLDLKTAEQQVREAQIELSLERIRAQVTTMQESSDLFDIVVSMRNEFLALGHKADYFWHMRWSPDNYEMSMTSTEGNRLGMVITVPKFVHEEIQALIEWEKSNIPSLVLPLSAENAWDYIDKMNTYGHYEQMDPHAPSEEDIHHIGGLTFIIARTTHGEIGFSLAGEVHDPPKESIETLVRFAGVFDLAYRRFEDLKEAEAQRREAEIELALEKTRAQSMMMQHSDELNKTSAVFHEQLGVLGINSEFSYLWLPDEEHMEHQFWATWQEEKVGKQIFKNKQVIYPLDKTEPAIAECYVAWESGNPVHINPVKPDGVKEYFETWAELLDGVDKFKPENYPDGLYYVDAYMQYGCFGIMIKDELSEEGQSILHRFSKEFERAYTRFLDLQKAEAQTREAQIEASLEKVRSRTMAMQTSDELSEVSYLLNEQVRALGTKTWGCAFNIYGEDESTEWFGTEAGIMPTYKTPREKFFLNFYEKGQSGETFYVEEFSGKKCKDHYDYMCTLPVIGDMLNDLKAAGHAFPTHQIDHIAYFKYGYLLFITLEPAPEAHDIFRRFAKVFEQTYIRFLDLQSAEEQARQARIETALERVRARAMAMQEPEELKEVAQVLRTEMGKLEIEELETCSIYIKDNNSSKAECWYAIKDIRKDKTLLVKDQFELDLNQTWVGKEMLSFYNSQDDRVSILMKGDNRKEWMNYCEEHSKPLKGYYGDVIPERTYHLNKFSNGSIGFASAGNISDESWNILTRAASAFSLAYSRFQDLTRARHDLIKLKEEKKRAEDALSDLKEAQRQLIHAEKMASLGELTAGIAHEIQNPLNFVNNFSEVSGEMIDEVNEEIETGDMDEAKEILHDLKGNLEKINHHGQRASGIVKSMLDHSRTTSGEKVETDINALCDEYLRLAYHGMRAKDRSFNSNFEMDLDDSIPKIKVIPQDIGRVLLNLINNAFQAVHEKALSGMVKVTTKNLGDRIEITVSDNGPGIPDDIKDKIFQPFFTTKPTGQGTGLGLSLSYDIIKAYYGELKVETKEKEGTTFLVIIPHNK